MSKAEETLKEEFGLDYDYLIERGYHKHIVKAMRNYAHLMIEADREKAMEIAIPENWTEVREKIKNRPIELT